jgi:hypothetical protein
VATPSTTANAFVHIVAKPQIVTAVSATTR